MLDGSFAGAVAHFGELLLVGGEFGVEFGELDVEAFYSCVDLGQVSSDGGGKCGVEVGTFEMALVRVGLGPVLFAPKRRFILACCFS